jgi:CheY-like chemotaxis protein
VKGLYAAVVNERVLVVDDEPSVHEVVRAYLERERRSPARCAGDPTSRS